MLFSCFTALETNNACQSNQQTVLDANADDFFLSENQLDQCISQNKELIIQAKDGQVMNISQINLDHSGNNQSPYGSVEDVKSGKQSLIGHGPRLNHLMLSTSNEITVIVSGVGSEDNRFMLHIQGIYIRHFQYYVYVIYHRFQYSFITFDLRYPDNFTAYPICDFVSHIVTISWLLLY